MAHSLAGFLFARNMDDLAIKGLATEDTSEGNRLEVREVPTIFIHGKRLKNMSLQGFETIFQKELKKSGKR